MRLPFFFSFLIRYVTPAYLFVMLGLWCRDELGKYVTAVRSDKVSMLSFLLVMMLTVFLLVLINIAGRRWRAEQRDVPGRTAFPVAEATR
jgi:hypothetical protein